MSGRLNNNMVVGIYLAIILPFALAVFLQWMGW
jgi:hypothetical protein